MIYVVSFCFFFFKQKTAYEMRISDWSSDVCSSDLLIFAKSGLAFQRSRANRNGELAPLYGVPGLAFQRSRANRNDIRGQVAMPTGLAFQRSRANRNLPTIVIVADFGLAFQRSRANRNGNLSRDRKSTRLNSSH